MAIVFTKLSKTLLADREEAVQYVECKLRQQLRALRLVPDSVESLSGWMKNTAEATVFLASANKLPQPQLASEATCAKERSLLEKPTRQQLERYTDCALAREASSRDPQEKDEVKNQRFTYLEMPFKDIPKYTGALVRCTNQAEYCLFTVGYLFKPHDVRKELKSLDAVVHQVPPCLVQPYSRAIGIAIALAKALLSAIGEKVGALIMNEIFPPPGVPSYFDEVNKEIERIVNQELTQNTVDEINGQINGLKNWVAITYTNAKESGSSKKELTDMLQPREPQMAIELIGVLMESRYAAPGVCVFMIGAGMHLAILQELALVDPNVSSPSQSSYAQSVRDYAKNYAEHGKKTANQVYESRKNMVQPKRDTYIPPSNTVFRNYFWFEDALTGYRSRDWLNTIDSKGESNPDAPKQRDAAMVDYRNTKYNELVESMDDPVSTADEWLKLIDQPLPE